MSNASDNDKFEDSTLCELETDKVIDAFGRDKLIDFTFDLSQVPDYKDRLVIVYGILDNLSQALEVSQSEHVSFALSIFTTVLNNAPDGPSKDEFIDYTIRIMNTLKETSKKPS